MPHDREAVGKRFDLESMRFASEQSWRAVETMASVFKPGLRESEAATMGDEILRDLGMERHWHPLQVRFGTNTTRTFRQKSVGDPVLGDDDIYFIDIGPVFKGHEGDVGATFTTGSDVGKSACAAAAKTLFGDVSERWKQGVSTGSVLYEFAAVRALELGWRLNMGVQGHRVSDFPHAIHRGGYLGALEKMPTAGVWILEIQIAHLNEAYGAFYEDILI